MHHRFPQMERSTARRHARPRERPNHAADRQRRKEQPKPLRSRCHGDFHNEEMSFVSIWFRSCFITVHTNPKRQRGPLSLALRVSIETASYPAAGYKAARGRWNAINIEQIEAQEDARILRGAIRAIRG
jgi:hypothetical protein